MVHYELADADVDPGEYTLPLHISRNITVYVEEGETLDEATVRTVEEMMDAGDVAALLERAVVETEDPYEAR